MQRHTLFARFLTFLLGMFMVVGIAAAQPYGGNDPSDPTLERLTAILDSLAGGTFSGNPCDLTPEQRNAFDQVARQEFGFEFGWGSINCDSTRTPCDSITIPIDPIGERIATILDSLSGGFFNGDPCSLTTEQRQAFDSLSQAEFGFNFGWGEIDCSGNGGDPTKDRIMEIIDSVAGGGFTGNPCDLTLEQRQDIDRQLQQEFGFDFGWSSINCDGIDWGSGSGGDTIIVGGPCGNLTPEQLLAICQILEEVAGGDFSGDICDLTLGQRQEIDRRMMEEVGISFGLADFPCGGIIARDPSNDNAGKARQTQQAIARMATINRQESIEGVALHPNPARTELTVTFTMNRTAQAEVVVVNGLGETVMARNLGTLANGQHTANLDVSEMGTGAYFVKVQLNGRTIQTTPLRVAH